MQEMMEWIYSHITWILYMLLFMFLGSMSIFIFQLNNYNHTTQEVLSRYGGLTYEASKNLNDEHKQRYGVAFYVTTPDGDFFEQSREYGKPINYVIHFKLPFFNDYLTRGKNGIHGQVPSDTRSTSNYPEGQTIDYNMNTDIIKQMTPFGEEFVQGDVKYDSSKLGDVHKDSGIKASDIINNLQDGDRAILLNVASSQSSVNSWADNYRKNVFRTKKFNSGLGNDFTQINKKYVNYNNDQISNDKKVMHYLGDMVGNSTGKPIDSIVNDTVVKNGNLEIGTTFPMYNYLHKNYKTDTDSYFLFLIYRPGNLPDRSPIRNDDGSLSLAIVHFVPDNK